MSQIEINPNEMKKKHDLELVIHQMLVWGVIVSSALMLLGLLIAVIQGTSVPDQVPPMNEVIAQALQLRPAGVMALGLLALIATPILRVLFSIFGFLYERDYRFALVTLVVFLVVLASIFFGGE